MIIVITVVVGLPIAPAKERMIMIANRCLIRIGSGIMVCGRFGRFASKSMLSMDQIVVSR